MSLSFLSNITLASNEEVAPTFISSKSTRSSVNRNPEGSTIRVFKNGAIYPSKELVERFHLEYEPKDSEVKNYGFDIMSSKSFPNTSHLESKFMIIAVVEKSLPKVDVFGSTKYYSEKDLETDPTVVVNSPKSSVIDQGNTTFGKEVLIPMLEEVYGFTFDEETKFVDLVIVTDQQLQTNDGNYFIPKFISRGEKKGEVESVVRKNIEMFPLVLSEMLSSEERVEGSAEEVAVEENLADVPEIDMTEKKPSKAAKAPVTVTDEPTIDDIIDADLDEVPPAVINEDSDIIDVDGEAISPEIDVDPISTEEEPEEDEEEFGDLKI